MKYHTSTVLGSLLKFKKNQNKETVKNKKKNPRWLNDMEIGNKTPKRQKISSYQ